MLAKTWPRGQAFGYWMKTDKGRLQVLMVEGLDFRVPGLESFVCRVYAAGLIRIHDCFRVQSRPLMDAVMLDHIRCRAARAQFSSLKDFRLNQGPEYGPGPLNCAAVRRERAFDLLQVL